MKTTTPRKVKCSRVRACKWEGIETDIVYVNYGLGKGEFGRFGTCPKCGCKEFYNVKSADSKPGSIAK